MSQTRDRVMNKYRGVTVIDAGISAGTVRYFIRDHRRDSDPTVTAAQATFRAAQRNFINGPNLNGQTTQFWFRRAGNALASERGVTQGTIDATYP